MQKLWYLAVMGLAGCATVNVGLAQSSKPMPSKPFVSKIAPEALRVATSTKPSGAANGKMLAPQAPARSLSAGMIDAAATKAIAKSDGFPAAKAVSGGSIAKASIAAQGALLVPISKTAD